MVGHDLVLGRVRAYGHARDWISSRIWLDRALRDIVDGLPGIAPEATLLVRTVRHLRAPPQRAASSGSAELIRWRSALRAELSRLARDAARPALGAVPASAPAVLFADGAELLSCLADDWLTGALPDRWWWQSLRAVVDDPDRALTTAWGERAGQAPAALELLARRKRHLAFAARLPLAAVTELTTAIAREWTISWLLRVAQLVATLPAEARSATAADGSRAPVVPWRATSPEVAHAGLHPARQLFLGLGMMLDRAPAVAVAASTGDAVRRWLAALSAAAPMTSDGVSAEPTDRGLMASRQSALGSASPKPAGAARRAAEPQPVRTPDPDADERPVAPALQEIQTAAARAPARPPARATVPQQPAATAAAAASPLTLWSPAGGSQTTSAPGAAVGQAPGGGGVRRDPPGGAGLGRPAPVVAWPSPASSRSTSLPPSSLPRVRDLSEGPLAEPLPTVAGAQSRPAAGLLGGGDHAFAVGGGEATPSYTISTRLGGIFYLLQPALIIGHYGDFTMPLTPGLALSPWDWLTLVGTYLMPRAAVRDPIWELLAGLAGRSVADLPGQGFHPPRCWRVAPAWLEALPPTSRPWAWTADRGRLVIRHPLGFSVVDIPARGDPVGQVRAELDCYRPRAIVPTQHPLPGRPPPPRVLGARLTPSLARWREWTGEYVRAWLRSALGIPPRAAVGGVIVLRTARVRATAERVDVTLVLDELPFEIRLAGLDLDPGWIPATGRTVAFHYD